MSNFMYMGPVEDMSETLSLMFITREYFLAPCEHGDCIYTRGENQELVGYTNKQMELYLNPDKVDISFEDF